MTLPVSVRTARYTHVTPIIAASLHVPDIDIARAVNRVVCQVAQVPDRRAHQDERGGERGRGEQPQGHPAASVDDVLALLTAPATT
ncbi:hypothetical protein [Dactylosporangium sp. NPDC005555]|uniref:hypothetical protein n=1 Tax=Dactylosporangium sp. NPDC005555 TaxID=3154889 RepID=UPI0033A6C81B